MPQARVREHNEYFQPITKRTCPCGERKTEVWAWGEYVRAKWRTVDHFCQACFVERVQSRLVIHAGDCGCEFNLRPRTGRGSLPDWITMPPKTECKLPANGMQFKES